MASTPSSDVLKHAQALLREGKTQEADDILSEAQAASDKAAGVEPTPKPPRQQPEVLRDILRAVIAHLGNHPDLAKLLAEYDGEEKK